MKASQRIEVRIYSVHEKVSSGTVYRQVWEKKERTLRAIKAFGISWGFALIAVLIPGLHFFLVPAFILGGPIAFIYVVGQTEVILGGEGLCPECGKEFKIVRSAVKWPISDLCNHCQSQLKIEPVESKSG